MKKRILFILVLVLSFSFFVKNVSANELCSSNGYTILTVNGIFTDEVEARENKRALERKLLVFPTYKNEPLKVDYLYNPTHLLGVMDLVDVLSQMVIDDNSDYDMVEILNDASQKVTTQKLLLVGHSQGNFYANNLYDAVASKPGGVPSQSIGVYGVASPASRVAGGGKYLTSSLDTVINSLMAQIVSNKILPSNINLPLQSIQNGNNGHGFSDTYLRYAGDRIVSDIKFSLNKLQNNDEQLPQDPCISPPELTLVHKAWGVGFTVADSIINNAAKASIYIANTSYNIGAAIGSFIRNTTLSINNALSELFATAVESLPEASSVTTILPGLSVSESENTNTENTEELPPQKTPPQAPSQNEQEQVSATNNKTTTITKSNSISDENKNVTDNISQPVVPNVVFPGGGGGDNSGGGGNNRGNPPNNDTIAPVISITGASLVNVTKNTIYIDAGATATDETDGVRAVTTTGSVDTTTLGEYTFTYTASDLSNNIATSTRTVNVVADVAGPVITLIGNETEMVRKNSVYTDAGATANDVVDGVITVVKTGSIDTSILGTYTITYTATDLSNNVSTKTRTVIVDDGAKLNRPNHVAVSGNYAYVVSENSNSLEIIDISNPATLVHKSSLVHNNDNIQMFAPKAVAVSGNYAYVVSYSNNLNVIDISNPILPVIKSTLNNGDGGAQLIRPTSIIISGNYAYIATNGHNNVEIVDISDPMHPIHKSVYSLGSLSMPSSIFISGNYMYLTYTCLCTGGDGFQIVDISNPALPVLKSTLSDGTGGADISTPRSVFVSGNYAYIASWNTKSLEIVDISDPAHPVHKGKLTTGFGGANFTPNYIFVSGNYAYITSWVGETLEIVDVSDPANPVHKGSLANNIGGSALSYPSSVFVSENYAYVSSYMSNALEIVDISDPTFPIHKNKILDGEFDRSDPVPRAEKQITAFNFAGLNPIVVGVIDETDHTVSLIVPFGTNVTTLVPTITISSGATINPNTGVTQNFTSPVTYTVTAENSSTQSYNVTVTVAPDSNSGPDTTPPSVTGYTFNAIANNITTNPLTSPLSLVINASENVDWTSVKIENRDNASIYKIFYSGAGCVNGTNTCTKSWNGLLTRGGLLQNGTFRVKVHMKDSANNDFYDYLSPYVITVNTSL